ncbi:DUF1028 domain-containing protein [Rahnella sp. SAP-1]|jgi:uncharacterized Ntn-hydrolase superfamily protein|uniref:DUF1028 domain-containing protein n=1 Tax=Rouxiella aceris TaxID=2703884 RepID=A0A848MKG5_9GAMM|nr:DUF1028 domain-containing protein [Rouxiella aceris]NMP27560.1 DUF1028 domain-containing protein [Rouxiella aceris]
MTFSIAGFCPRSGQYGIALSSSSMAVAARCPWLMSGVGAVSSQNVTLPSLGPKILERMRMGESAAIALDNVMAAEPFADWRQVTVLDNQGQSAVFSGAHTLGINHHRQGVHCVAAGNMLANSGVIEAMVSQFCADPASSLGDRLIAALQAGLRAGGEAGPIYSAGMKIVSSESWPLTDLRVDWHEQDAIGELARFWQLWQPQSEAYLTRAINPAQAPSYGVPGDE